MATECPTGRYASEIVTAGGLTLAKPVAKPGSIIDWSGSEWDFAEWHALGAALLGRLEQAWRNYMACPGTKSFDVTTHNGFVERINDVRDRWARLRIPWRGPESAFGTTGWTWGIALPDLAWDATDEIGIATGLIVDAQCLRQRLDEATESMGCSIDGPGGTAHDPATEGLGILGTALLVGTGAIVVGGSIFLARTLAKRRTA